MQGADGDSTSAASRSAGSPDEIRDRSDGIPDRPPGFHPGYRAQARSSATTAASACAPAVKSVGGLLDRFLNPGHVGKQAPPCFQPRDFADFGGQLFEFLGRVAEIGFFALGLGEVFARALQFGFSRLQRFVTTLNCRQQIAMAGKGVEHAAMVGR